MLLKTIATPPNHGIADNLISLLIEMLLINLSITEKEKAEYNALNKLME